MTQNSGQSVTWKAFGIFVSISLAILAILGTVLSKEQQDMTEIRVDVASIENDVSWIKDELEDRCNVNCLNPLSKNDVSN